MTTNQMCIDRNMDSYIVLFTIQCYAFIKNEVAQHVLNWKDSQGTLLT